MRLLTILTLLFLVCNVFGSGGKTSDRTFVVDWEGNRFLKDGKPFRFIAGSFHYFRAHPNTWQRKLRTMRAAGINAVTTCVEWSLHNPKDGVYVWDGIANLEQFIKDAIAEDLLVILRPGPYICAERDLGGFPYWILNKYPNIKLRTADINYLYEVRIWYAELMSKMIPYLYGNGGPIIMVQVENEYGSYYACDNKYKTWLRDETLAYVKNNSVLFTTDGPSVLRCGHIDGVLATLDFGATDTLSDTWKRLRQIQPKGPLVNAEYYPGWLTHWTERMARVQTDVVTKTFRDMLNGGASVNFYMFYGGTNFGFTAGANDGGPGKYQPDITSYDYDAPMDEAGDPTPKFYKIREVIGEYLPLPNITIPPAEPKKAYGSIKLLTGPTLLSDKGRQALSTGVFIAEKPMTFEALNQYSGLVLYETFLPIFNTDPLILRASGVHDRAYVYVDGNFVGIMARQVPTFNVPISPSFGRRLQILVENQGRINFGLLDDFKGLTSDVFLGRQVLTNWNMTKFPLESYEDIQRLIETEDQALHLGFKLQTGQSGILYNGPTVFYATVNIEEGDLGDTYLDPTGWGKGIVFVNGENIGRYWPLAGPQVTLYIPKEVLRVGANMITIIEYQTSSISGEITLTDTPNLDAVRRSKNKSFL